MSQKQDQTTKEEMLRQAKLFPIVPHDQAGQEIFRRQRVMCGWKSKEVPKMCDQMARGERVIFWIGIPAHQRVSISQDGRRVKSAAEEQEEKEEAVGESNTDKGDAWLKLPLLQATPVTRFDSPMVRATSTMADNNAEHDGKDKWTMIPIGHIAIDSDDFDPVPSQMLFPADSRTLSLTTLFVLPAYRKYGLGTWAMHECERLVREEVIVVPLSSPSDSKASNGMSQKCNQITLTTLHRRHLYEEGPEGRGLFERAGTPDAINHVKYNGDWYKKLGYELYHEQPKYLLNDNTSGEVAWWAEFWRKTV